jgi:hypothetical protein
MKKSMLCIMTFALSGFIFSSCAIRLFEGRTYVSGQHASKQGTKAQARTNKQAKHFWF